MGSRNRVVERDVVRDERLNVRLHKEPRSGVRNNVTNGVRNSVTNSVRSLAQDVK